GDGPTGEVAGFETAIRNRPAGAGPAAHPARLDDLADVVGAGRQVREGVLAVGVGDLRRLAGVKTPVAVLVEEDLPASEGWFAGILDAVAVEVVELHAADFAADRRGRESHCSPRADPG